MENKILSFKASFCNTESMQKVAKYAVGKGKFAKLNEARKNIAAHDWFTKLEMNCGFDETKKKSFFEITRFKPKYIINNGQIEKIYNVKTTKKYYDTTDAIRLACAKIIKMSKSAPNNKLYKDMVK